MLRKGLSSLLRYVLRIRNSEQKSIYTRTVSNPRIDLIGWYGDFKSVPKRRKQGACLRSDHVERLGESGVFRPSLGSPRYIVLAITAPGLTHPRYISVSICPRAVS